MYNLKPKSPNFPYLRIVTARLLFILWGFCFYIDPFFLPNPTVSLSADHPKHNIHKTIALSSTQLHSLHAPLDHAIGLLVLVAMLIFKVQLKLIDVSLSELAFNFNNSNRPVSILSNQSVIEVTYFSWMYNVKLYKWYRTSKTFFFLLQKCVTDSYHFIMCNYSWDQTKYFRAIIFY